MRNFVSRRTLNVSAVNLTNFVLNPSRLQRERAENERHAHLHKELSQINIVSPDHQPDQYSISGFK